MATATYYPTTNDGRAHWWQNIIVNGPAAFSALGWSSPVSGPIIADANVAVYAYLTLRTTYDVFNKAIISYCDGLLDEGTGADPTPPAAPSFPTPPSGNGPGLEKRRERWVQEAKNEPAYNLTLGVLLGIETPAVPFNRATYQAELYSLSALNPHSVSGKFRKAGGQLDSINFYGRKHNVGGEWGLLGKFSATPFTAHVPVTGTSPEEWEFYAQAVRRDVEFGLPSDTIQQVIRP